METVAQCKAIVNGAKGVSLSFTEDNVKEKDSDGMTPLHYMCYLNISAIIEDILGKGADIEAKNSNGMTPLHIACINDSDNVVSCLLEKNANINAQDKSLNTPLHYAFHFGNERIVEILLDNENIIVSLKNKANDLPIQCATNEDTIRAYVNYTIKDGISRNLVTTKKSIVYLGGGGFGSIFKISGTDNCQVIKFNIDTSPKGKISCEQEFDITKQNSNKNFGPTICEEPPEIMKVTYFTKTYYGFRMKLFDCDGYDYVETANDNEVNNYYTQIFKLIDDSYKYGTKNVGFYTSLDIKINNTLVKREPLVVRLSDFSPEWCHSPKVTGNSDFVPVMLKMQLIMLFFSAFKKKQEPPVFQDVFKTYRSNIYFKNDVFLKNIKISTKIANPCFSNLHKMLTFYLGSNNIIKSYNTICDNHYKTPTGIHAAFGSISDYLPRSLPSSLPSSPKGIKKLYRKLSGIESFSGLNKYIYNGIESSVTINKNEYYVNNIKTPKPKVPNNPYKNYEIPDLLISKFTVDSEGNVGIVPRYTGDGNVLEINPNTINPKYKETQLVGAQAMGTSRRRTSRRRRSYNKIQRGVRRCRTSRNKKRSYKRSYKRSHKKGISNGRRFGNVKEMIATIEANLKARKKPSITRKSQIVEKQPEEPEPMNEPMNEPEPMKEPEPMVPKEKKVPKEKFLAKIPTLSELSHILRKKGISEEDIKYIIENKSPMI